MRQKFALTVTSIILSCFLFSCVNDSPVNNDPPGESETVLFINEVLSTGSPDWLEIYNPGATSVDVSDFYVFDEGTIADKYSLPSGTTVPAHGYLVLSCDDLATGLSMNFKLSSGGETVYLEDASHVSIDNVIFPALSDGTSYGRSEDGSSTWVEFSSPSPGVANGTPAPNEAPEIDDVSRSPQSPTPVDTVTISATVTDDYGLESVALYYKTSGATFTELAMSETESDVYEAKLPPSPDSTVVSYYIEAVDDSSATTVDPTTAPVTNYSYTSLASAYSPPALYINEFLASNDACCADEFGDYDDFIEIYNGSDESVDVGGMYITDDLLEPTTWQIPLTAPDSTTIPAGGFLLLWADKEPTQGVLHVNVKLSGGGEQVGLFAIDAFNNVLIDSLTYGDQEADTSYGRSPDGTDNWGFLVPTPGETNTQ